MAVVWDAGMLSLLLHQTERLPCPPGSKIPITHPRERIELLLSELAKRKETILIPSPALAEFLYLVEEAGPSYLKTIDKKSSFEVASFDEKAAIEAALMKDLACWCRLDQPCHADVLLELANQQEPNL